MKKKKRQGKNKSIEMNSKVTNMELIDKNFKTLIINIGKDVKNMNIIGESKTMKELKRISRTEKIQCLN